MPSGHLKLHNKTSIKLSLITAEIYRADVHWSEKISPKNLPFYLLSTAFSFFPLDKKKYISLTEILCHLELDRRTKCIIE